MSLIIFVISLVALYFAYSAYRMALHPQRFELYKAVQRLLNQIVSLNLNGTEDKVSAQLTQLYLQTNECYKKSRWLIGYDEPITQNLNSIETMIASLNTMYTSDHSPVAQEGMNKKNTTQELLQFSNQWLNSSLDNDFDTYLSLPLQQKMQNLRAKFGTSPKAIYARSVVLAKTGMTKAREGYVKMQPEMQKMKTKLSHINLQPGIDKMKSGMNKVKSMMNKDKSL